MTAATPEDPYDAIAGARVPRVRTPMTREQVRVAMDAGHSVTFGVHPSYRRLAVACAMVWLEGANGAALWNYDFGNIGKGTFAGDTFALTAREVLHGRDVMVTQLERAHSCAEAGAADYWDFLSRSYPDALALFDGGDVAAVVGQLKARGYFTGSLADYVHQMVALVAEYEHRWPE